jgi:hypothetical protein
MKLALVLKKLTVVGTKMETTSNKLLAVVRGSKLTNIKAWRAAVKDAYAANGWHMQRGKPKLDSTSSPVPRTVRTYVSEVSSAFRFNLDVPKFASFYELRQAVVQARRKKSPAGRIEKLVGEPLHDAGTLAIRLTGKPRESFIRELTHLVAKYQRLFGGKEPLEMRALRRVA